MRRFKIMSYKDIRSEAFLFPPLLLIFIVFSCNPIAATQDLSRDPFSRGLELLELPLVVYSRY